MKTLFPLIIIILLIFSCQEEKITSNNRAETKTHTKAEKELWVLSNYIDSVIENKEIATYRVQAPTWFGILLEIDTDSIISYGSLVEIESKLKSSHDTIVKFNTYGGKWFLLKKEKKLILKQEPNQKNVVIDTTVYVYSKRNDLKFLTQNLDKVHKISSNITNYLNEKILAGTYQNAKTEKEVKFDKNGRLYGFENYIEFQIRDYFGTSHPHKNLDVVFFKNRKEKIFKQFNWKFIQNQLILTEFISEEIEIKGKKVITDNYVLGKKEIILVKKH